MGQPLDRVDSHCIGVVEATEKFVDHSGLLIAKALVCPETGTVPLRIMNLSNGPVTLYKNTIPTMYEPVEIGKHETVNDIGTVSSTAEESFTHVEDLLSQSSSNLNETQVNSLRSLLYEYKDHFSKSSHD